MRLELLSSACIDPPRKHLIHNHHRANLTLLCHRRAAFICNVHASVSFDLHSAMEK